MDMAYYKKYEPFFGSWHIAEMLGEGSFGKVFAIERQDFGETYKAALKVITVPQNESEVKSVMSNGMDNASVTEYFEGVVKDTVSEFVQMSKLKGNSNVVSYEDHQVIPHDGKRIGWDILIRMELLTPLLDYAQNSELTRKDIMKLGIDMCHALELCQKHNIIHRDIKPENIFVSENGNFKLGDFGIARTIEKTSSGLSKKGTYTYMAPEVYKGEEYGSSVDIYSLGIVLYRLLNNNRTLFLPSYPEKIKHSDLDNALVRRISGEVPPAPEGADGRLAEIVLKACAYSPRDRYSSPMQMRQELEAILYEPGKAHEIYPQGDDVVVKPNEYATSEEENESNYTFEDEGTVSIFGNATRQPVEDPQTSAQSSVIDPSAKFCMNCGDSIPANAKFCMGCGTKIEQQSEKPNVHSSVGSSSINNSTELKEVEIPTNSVIPISLAPGEIIILQSIGGTFETDEGFAQTNVSHTISKKKGYITLSNQRVIWSETKGKPKKAVLTDETSIYFNDISAFTPWSFPDANVWPKISHAFLLSTSQAKYGFYFDDDKDNQLLKKRNTLMEYMCQERGITFAPNNASVVPVTLFEDEYIEIQGFGAYAKSTWSSESGCITITNRRFIWTSTSLFGKKRPKDTSESCYLHEIRSITTTKTGVLTAEFSMETDEYPTQKYAITLDNEGDKAVLRDWIVCFIQENLQ